MTVQLWVVTVGLMLMAFLECTNILLITKGTESLKIGLFKLRIMLRKKVGDY